MKIRVLGCGFYGAHIASALIDDGHDVEIHEISDNIFAGASGNIPARCHVGFHYPRSRMTRAACLEHSEEFMREYGFLTRNVPINIYAIAKESSLVDYDQYIRTLEGEVQFIEIEDPSEYGLFNVEGAILTGERHIVTDDAKEYFKELLGFHVKHGVEPGEVDSKDWDWTIDCTFCANDAAGVDRYEPCLVAMLRGPTDRAITIMDGPFGSLYPWNEEEGLCSLSSAKWTPFSKTCETWDEAQDLLKSLKRSAIEKQARSMFESLEDFYPALGALYDIVGHKLSVRAMPASGADTRLVDVVKVGDRALRVRAGKIDAIIHAEKIIKGMIS